jgi:hypothetical protein
MNAHYEELVAENHALREENAKLLEMNETLDTDNQRLRERLKQKRREIPRGCFTFGKWQGSPLTEIDTNYLQWALRTCFSKLDLARKQTRALRDGIVRELHFRGEMVAHGECEEYIAPKDGYRVT